MYRTDRKGKIKIEVHDASIIKSNEHPNFKIGDVINIGQREVIIKGFSRSILGLAYVLDDGNELFNWLTEQFDAKFQRKQNMSKIPDKIYITPNFDRRWFTKEIDDENVEYVRTDAFIEKAKKFILDRVAIPFKVKCCNGEPLADSYAEYELARLEAANKMIESFVDYMKGE